MGAAELSQQDLGVSRAVTEGNEGAAPVRGLSLIKNTIRARATASRILEERALSSWQRVGRNGKCVCIPSLTGRLGMFRVVPSDSNIGRGYCRARQ